ncbi:hypothetical protein CDQ84_05035 [Clostridium thermosuccinogenes]|uniref:Uncharacterized protein n=1 Tax=Clostridium thermosuccinogenes TaxID=84032 RepID=A0A2K2FPA3_9CLOT|nr:hypothetical protein CDO33_07535 [Pseudoclostridium thermosuccinogenes]PNT93034.1 hypothetical protein CDQ83_05670 [Pseudoclostridium thermosuccinogenes]PNT98508.1 hypothetical protein CDQ85_04940 [Pseudoclostridium thermosuccinogenes]PNU00610.1 hypothetical protein CDQ84_05035 [Pseudoclostridium thermosuccinogenes]
MRQSGKVTWIKSLSLKIIAELHNLCYCIGMGFQKSIQFLPDGLQHKTWRNSRKIIKIKFCYFPGGYTQ